jgi:hypothetical protein
MPRCVICNEEVPEGRQICPICDPKEPFGRDEIHFSRMYVPPTPNVTLSFGDEEYRAPSFEINYYRKKRLSKFQIWMFKACFGITAKNL